MLPNIGTKIRQNCERQSIPGVNQAGQSAVLGRCGAASDEKGEKGSFTADRAMTAAKTALRFIGNASIQTARERHKRAITEKYPELIDL